MDGSMSKPDKSAEPTGVAEPEVLCECVFACICDSKNREHVTPGSGDNKASRLTILDYSNKPPNFSNDTSCEQDPDVFCAHALKVDRDNGHKSCNWSMYKIARNNAEINVSNDLDTYVLASHLFDYCTSKRNVKNKDRSRKLHMDYYDQILEIYSKVCSTEKELDKDDFVKMTDILTKFKEKGLITIEIFSNFKKVIKENGFLIPEIDDLSSSISELNMEDFHQKSNSPRYFNTIANKFYCDEDQELVGDMKDFEYKYPDIIFVKIMEPIEKSDAITSRINILNSLDFLVVMCDIEFLNKENWLCHCDLSKFIDVNQLAIDLLSKKAKLAKQMRNPLKRILDGIQFMPNGEIKYDVENREWPMEDANWELNGQKICITGLSGHNTPFCEMCGLQSSWLKTFKKRGIQIRVADSSNKEHTWNNNTKDK